MIVPAQQQFAQAARDARARMAAAAMAPRLAVTPKSVIVRSVASPQPFLSDREAQSNEYFYLSSLATDADIACASPVSRINTGEAYASAKVKDIILQVCRVSGFSYLDIISQRRHGPLVLARQFAMWRAKNETTRSYPDIGRRFGGRDHSTGIHAVKKIDRLLAAGLIPPHWLATTPNFQQEPTP